jgi:hypothetical protein
MFQRIDSVIYHSKRQSNSALRNTHYASRRRRNPKLRLGPRFPFQSACHARALLTAGLLKYFAPVVQFRPYVSAPSTSASANPSSRATKNLQIAKFLN